jgi:hypothetical protein
MRATEVTFVFAGRVIVTVNVDPYAIVAGSPLSVGRVLVRYGGERYSTPDNRILSRAGKDGCKSEHTVFCRVFYRGDVIVRVRSGNYDPPVTKKLHECLICGRTKEETHGSKEEVEWYNRGIVELGSPAIENRDPAAA